MRSAKLERTANQHVSSVLNVTVGMKADISLPVDEVMRGAGGKFRVNDVTSQADLIRHLAKLHEEETLLELVTSAKLGTGTGLGTLLGAPTRPPARPPALAPAVLPLPPL